VAASHCSLAAIRCAGKPLRWKGEYKQSATQQSRLDMDGMVTSIDMQAAVQQVRNARLCTFPLFKLYMNGCSLRCMPPEVV